MGVGVGYWLYCNDGCALSIGRFDYNSVGYRVKWAELGVV